MTELLLIGITIVNLGILTLSLKLYTEYFKDKSASNRNRHE